MDELIKLDQIDEVDFNATQEDEQPINLGEGLAVFSGGGSGGGITYEEFEEALETKVDKTNGVLKIYGTDENGSPAEYNLVSNTYTANSIVQRSGTGTIHTADPQWGNEAANKRYVDENFVSKQTPEFDAGATRGYAYVIEQEKNAETGEFEQFQRVKKLQIQANPDTIPLRNPSGTFYVGNATLPYEAVNKGYVDGLVSGLTGLKLSVVDTLPTENISESTIYLVAVEGSTNNVYDEYLYINGVWEKIGSTQVEVDLTEYVKKTDYAGNSIAGVVDVRAFFGLMTDQYGRIQVVKATEDEIKAKANEYHPLTPKDIDITIVQGLTSNSIELSAEQLDSAQRWLGLEAINEALESILGV